MEEAMELSMQRGWRKVSFISDSLITMKALTSRANDLSWEIYAPTQKIRENTKESTVVKFKATLRNHNAVAHSLATICLFLNYDVPCNSIS